MESISHAFVRMSKVLCPMMPMGQRMSAWYRRMGTMKDGPSLKVSHGGCDAIPHASLPWSLQQHHATGIQLIPGGQNFQLARFYQLGQDRQFTQPMCLQPGVRVNRIVQ